LLLAVSEWTVGLSPYQIIARLGWDLSLRSSFHTPIPRKPYCTDHLDQGLHIRSRQTALTRRYVQMNGPLAHKWMLHDIDTPGAALAYRDAVLPAPNIIMINPDNGHAHIAYLLETGVARSANSRLAPLRYLAAVERGFARRLGADRNYAGLVAKNSIHPHWRGSCPRQWCKSARHGPSSGARA
jgi:Replicase family